MCDTARLRQPAVETASSAAVMNTFLPPRSQVPPPLPESRGKEEDDDDVKYEEQEEDEKQFEEDEKQFEEYKVEGQYHIKVFRNAVREHDKLFETGVCVRVRVHVHVCVLVCLCACMFQKCEPFVYLVEGNITNCWKNEENFGKGRFGKGKSKREAVQQSYVVLDTHKQPGEEALSRCAFIIFVTSRNCS